MKISLPLRRAFVIAATLAAIPIALSACSAPAPVEEKPTTTPTPTSEAQIPEEEKEEEPEVAAGFVDVFDNSGIVTVQVPDTWAQVDGAPVTAPNGVQFVEVLASPDIAGYQGSWEVPGVTVSATQDFSVTPEEYLVDVVTSYGGDCGDPETDLYDDGLYVGTYLYLPECGGVGSELLTIVASNPDQTHWVRVQIQMVSDDDKTTIRDQILTTFLATFP